MFKGQVILQNFFSFTKGIEGKASKKMHRAAAMLTAGTLVFSLFDVLPEQVILAEGSEENFAVSSAGNFSLGSEEYFSESFSVSTKENGSADAEEENEGLTKQNVSETGADEWITVSLQLKSRLNQEKNYDEDKETKENPDSEVEKQAKTVDSGQEAVRETKAINGEREAIKETKAINGEREAVKDTKEINREQKAEKEETKNHTEEIAGAEPKDSREAQNAEVSRSDNEYQVLLKLVQAEAGGCDAMGKILVANVVLNRVKSEKFPDSISEVVYEKSQFSPAMNGTINQVNVSESTKECVARALNGEDYSQGALYFMNRGASQSGNVRWFDQKLTYLFQHDQHEFFK